MIKSYMSDDNNAIKLMNEYVNVIANYEMFHERMSKMAHLWGLQGLKRWHIKRAKTIRCDRIEFEHYSIDMFSEMLTAMLDTQMYITSSLKEYLELYLNQACTIYNTINKLSNQLIQMNLNHEARMLQKNIECVVKEIEKIRRWLLDYEKVNYDWDYIKICDKQLHDKIKEMD